MQECGIVRPDKMFVLLSRFFFVDLQLQNIRLKNERTLLNTIRNPNISKCLHVRRVTFTYEIRLDLRNVALKIVMS